MGIKVLNQNGVVDFEELTPEELLTIQKDILVEYGYAV